MADGSTPIATSLKGKVSEAEWKARVDLAALYRLVAVHGWDDMIFTHISARIPGPEHHFLINPYGLFFGEMTASSLVKVDLDGAMIDPGPYFINPAGFTIHSAVHAARDDAHFVMHLHTDPGVAVSANREGLLPLSQHALIVLPQLAYHDYEGIALNLDERERLVADLGEKKLMMLRNHGTLAVGSTAAECWLGMFFLERACGQQVMALTAGRDHVLEAPLAAQAEVRSQVGMGMGMIGGLAWPGCLRRLDRESRLRGLTPRRRKRRAAAILGVAAAFFCARPAWAGAWPMKDGEGLAILKYEDQRADEGFDPDGVRVAIDPRRDENLSLYGEYGLTGRLTLQAKAGVTRGHDRFVAYEGRGPIELGLRYALLRTDRSVVSLYLGAAKDGVGRNAGYATPGQGDTDLEARLLAGASRDWRGRHLFGEVQVARLARGGLADETRADVTLGLRPAKPWLLLAQAYAGQADSKPVGSRWLKAEASVVRDLGAWSLQAGWRQALSGRETPADHGVVLAAWRRF